MLVLGTILLCFGKGKKKNANFLTGSLYGVEDRTGVFFTTAYTGEKINKKPNKKQTDLTLPVSPKVGLGNNCPVLDVYDVVPRVSRINRTN